MDRLSRVILSKRYGVKLACLCAAACFLAIFAVSQPAWAQDGDSGGVWNQQSCAAEGGSWDSSENDCDFEDPAQGRDPNFLVDRYLVPIARFLAAVVGLVVVISIVVGGIQYSSAGDDPQKVGQAKSRILNSLLALVVFFLLYGLLEWVVPGGFL